jgi:hypothetical protein
MIWEGKRQPCRAAPRIPAVLPAQCSGPMAGLSRDSAESGKGLPVNRSELILFMTYNHSKRHSLGLILNYLKLRDNSVGSALALKAALKSAHEPVRGLPQTEMEKPPPREGATALSEGITVPAKVRCSAEIASDDPDVLRISDDLQPHRLTVKDTSRRNCVA